MTQAEALTRRAALMADKEWSRRYVEGGIAERTEMQQLNAIMAGTTVTYANNPAAEAETKRAKLMADPGWRALYLAGDVAAVAEMKALHATIAAAEQGDDEE